jgi:ethanolamine utilization protein EutA
VAEPGARPRPRPSHSHAFGEQQDHRHDDGSIHDHHHGWDLTVTDDRTEPTVFAANDVVELNTVGIDVGSSTTHVMFGHVRLERMAQSLSSRFMVTDRRTTWRSDIRLTPYADGNTIDASELERFFGSCFEDAGLAPSDVDTGVIILTGEALKRRNAASIAGLFADSAGRFVCALAGHHREATMAALGSGAQRLSNELGGPVLNIDVGGGTTKLALLVDGEIAGTAAFAVGGRLMIIDPSGTVTHVADPMRQIAAAAGVTVEVGLTPPSSDLDTIVTAMVNVVCALVSGDPSGPLARQLLVTEPMPDLPEVVAVTFSGGVAEYVYGRDDRSYGDLGRRLGLALRRAAEEGRLPARLVEPSQGIRATAVGLSQFSVQVSGNTISVSDGGVLPLRNVPVAQLDIDLSTSFTAGDVAAATSAACARADAVDGGPLALAVHWRGDPDHPRVHRVVEGLARGLASSDWGRHCPHEPVVILLDADLARTFGRVFAEELDLHRPVVCLDALELAECDYVDIGDVIQPGNVVPIVVKSLLFATAGS